MNSNRESRQVSEDITALPIVVLDQLLERTREYGLPLCLLFIDYEKAFDSVELNAVFKALIEQGIDQNYVELIREANTGCLTDIKLFHRDVRIPIGKGVRQGDPISPKLFTACLEMVFREIKWNGGVNINGEQLSHLRFADDVVLIARNSVRCMECWRSSTKEVSKWA